MSSFNNMSSLLYLAVRWVYPASRDRVAEVIGQVIESVCSVSTGGACNWSALTYNAVSGSYGRTKRAALSTGALRRIEAKLRSGQYWQLSMDDQPSAVARDDFEDIVYFVLEAPVPNVSRGDPTGAKSVWTARLLANRRRIRATQSLLDASIRIGTLLGSPYACVIASESPWRAWQEAAYGTERMFSAAAGGDVPLSPIENAAFERRRRFQQRRELWLRHLPMPHWGTWLSDSFVDRAGGVARLLEGPVHSVRALDDGSAFLQLTPEPVDVVYEPAFEQARVRLQNFLAPILLPEVETGEHHTA